jgi:hypothetical protein
MQPGVMAQPPGTIRLADADVQKLRLLGLATHDAAAAERSLDMAVATEERLSTNSPVVAEPGSVLTMTGPGKQAHLAVVGVVLLLQAPVCGLDCSIRRTPRYLKKRAHKEWMHHRALCLVAGHGWR